MKISRARITWFQCFGDSGDIVFEDGINLIVGHNNSGKSSLLKALRPSIPDDRHRTETVWRENLIQPPEIQLDIEISGNELRDIIREVGSAYVPVEPGQSPADYPNFVLAQKKIVFEMMMRPYTKFHSGYPSHGLFNNRPEAPKVSSRIDIVNGGITHSVHYGSEESLPLIVHHAWSNRMFYFSAERIASGESSPGYAMRLDPDASNLPNVLLTMSGDSGDIFRKLVGHLREIFPSVGNLSVRQMPTTSMLQIRVWPTEKQEVVEHSFPLSSSGTGVAQVTAILAAIMTTTNSVIIIDEVNNFLHPSAVKALLRIIKSEYNYHQYIISTHSPDVISYSDPATLHLVRRSGYESFVEAKNLDDVGNLRSILLHLGVSLGDIFVAERVVWVEGQTEEICFPYLYEKAVQSKLPRGTLILSVVATGDFLRKNRDRKLIYEIYNRLSEASAPLLRSVTFSFDSEKFSDHDKKNMIDDAGGNLFFLPRRHIECYLLDPAAIARFVSIRDSGCEQPIDSHTVSQKISVLAADKRFLIKEWNGDPSDKIWLSKVDAANLIDEIVKDISNQTISYRKKHDALEILKYIFEDNPTFLEELLNYVKLIVEQ